MMPQSPPMSPSRVTAAARPRARWYLRSPKSTARWKNSYPERSHSSLLMLNIEGGPAGSKVGAGRTPSCASDCTMKLQDGPGPARAEAKNRIGVRAGPSWHAAPPLQVVSCASSGPAEPLGRSAPLGRSERAERSKQPFGSGAALADDAHHAALRAA